MQYIGLGHSVLLRHDGQVVALPADGQEILVKPYIGSVGRALYGAFRSRNIRVPISQLQIRILGGRPRRNPCHQPEAGVVGIPHRGGFFARIKIQGAVAVHNRRQQIVVFRNIRRQDFRGGSVRRFQQHVNLLGRLGQPRHLQHVLPGYRVGAGSAALQLRRVGRIRSGLLHKVINASRTVSLDRHLGRVHQPPRYADRGYGRLGCRGILGRCGVVLGRRGVLGRRHCQRRGIQEQAASLFRASGCRQIIDALLCRSHHRRLAVLIGRCAFDLRHGSRLRIHPREFRSGRCRGGSPEILRSLVNRCLAVSAALSRHHKFEASRDFCVVQFEPAHGVAPRLRVRIREEIQHIAGLYLCICLGRAVIAVLRLPPGIGIPSVQRKALRRGLHPEQAFHRAVLSEFQIGRGRLVRKILPEGQLMSLHHGVQHGYSVCDRIVIAIIFRQI